MAWVARTSSDMRLQLAKAATSRWWGIGYRSSFAFPDLRCGSAARVAAQVCSVAVVSSRATGPRGPSASPTRHAWHESPGFAKKLTVAGIFVRPLPSATTAQTHEMGLVKALIFRSASSSTRRRSASASASVSISDPATAASAASSISISFRSASASAASASSWAGVLFPLDEDTFFTLLVLLELFRLRSSLLAVLLLLFWLLSDRELSSCIKRRCSSSNRARSRSWARRNSSSCILAFSAASSTAFCRRSASSLSR